MTSNTERRRRAGMLSAAAALAMAVGACGGSQAEPELPAVAEPEAEPAPDTPKSQVPEHLPVPWVIYDDQINTNGGGVLLAAPAQYTRVDVNWADNPHSGNKAIKVSFLEGYVWEEGAWEAAALIHTPDWKTYAKVPPMDLSGGGYTRCTFWARSDPPLTYLFVVGDNDLKIPITGEWAEYTIEIDEGTMEEVMNYFVVSYPEERPADIFVDDIVYHGPAEAAAPEAG